MEKSSFFTSQGRSDFHALQNAFRSGNDRSILYLVFDLMYYEGYDLRSAPLSERKALLADLMPQMEAVRFVDHVVGQGEEFYQAACDQKVEGILSKRLDSEYQSQRTRSWLKVKCAQRQEFVIGGYTESGAGRPFGSLLAGYFNGKGELVFAGKIKTGYGAGSSDSLIRTLRQYEQAGPPGRLAWLIRFLARRVFEVFSSISSPSWEFPRRTVPAPRPRRARRTPRWRPPA